MPTSFNDWKTVRETLSDIPLFLDREFILAIQKNIKICETRMLSLDPEAYNNYIEQKAKELKEQTKLAFPEGKI